jgi:hypothetical protein
MTDDKYETTGHVPAWVRANDDTDPAEDRDEQGRAERAESQDEYRSPRLGIRASDMSQRVLLLIRRGRVVAKDMQTGKTIARGEKIKKGGRMSVVISWINESTGVMSANAPTGDIRVHKQTVHSEVSTTQVYLYYTDTPRPQAVPPQAGIAL